MWILIHLKEHLLSRSNLICTECIISAHLFQWIHITYCRSELTWPSCFLIRNGIKQRKNSWQDGVLGTNCPIPPNSNYTYKFQTKDQIGGYTYFPSTLMHKAAGGFGALNVYARPRIPVPYSLPAGDFSLLIGDWRTSSHKVRNIYDFPILICFFCFFANFWNLLKKMFKPSKAGMLNVCTAYSEE